MNRFLFVLAAAVLGLSSLSAQGSIILQNPGFESPAATGTDQTPTSWGLFDNGPYHSGVTTALFQNGNQSLVFQAPGTGGAYRGYAQNVAITGVAGTELQFTAYLRADPTTPLTGDVQAVLGIEFRNGNSEINRMERDIAPSELLTSQWKPFTVTGFSGGTIDNVNFTILVKTGAGANSGTYYVDDVSAVPEPASLALVAASTACFLVRRRSGH